MSHYEGVTHFDDPGPDYLLSLLLHRSGVKRPGKDLHVTFFLRRSSARDALAQHPKGGERAHHQPAALSVAHRQHAIACSRRHKSGYVIFLALRKERGKKNVVYCMSASLQANQSIQAHSDFTHHFRLTARRVYLSHQ